MSSQTPSLIRRTRALAVCCLLVGLALAGQAAAALQATGMDFGRRAGLPFFSIQAMEDDSAAAQPGGVDERNPDDAFERDLMRDWPTWPEAPAGPDGFDLLFGGTTNLDETEAGNILDKELGEQAASANQRYGGTRRAPYPYYQHWASINTDQPGAGRWAWVNAQVGYWHESGPRRAWHFNHRQAIDDFVLGVEHTQAYTSTRGDALLWPRAWFGSALGLAGGYLYFGLGAGWIDDKADLHNEFSGDLHARAELYPVWPLGVEGGASMSFFTNSRTVLDWDVSLKLQVWRGFFAHAGFRQVRTLGRPNELRADGFFFGVNLVFSNLATAFWGPNGGPADALLTGDWDG